MSCPTVLPERSRPSSGTGDGRGLSGQHAMMCLMSPVAEPRGPLVGRATELARLAAAVGLDDPRSDRDLPGAVLVSGDAGVGKTRLLGELATEAEKLGYRVLVGHCLDFGDSALPYLPFSEAFGRLATESPTTATSLLESVPAIGRLMPSRRVIPAGDEGTDRRAASGAADEQVERPDLFASVHAALELLARGQPLLLVVEDVHWADRSTREILSYLFSRGFDDRVSVIASYRSDDLHRRHPLRSAVAEWSRLPRVTRIDLGRLPDDDVRALVEQLHPSPLSERALRGIVARAEGNAFFAEELVEAAELGPETLPEALADLLLVRLDRLDEDARLVVRAAAVAGPRVSHSLLARVVSDQVSSLDSALRVAVELNLLVPTGGDGYAFRHALLAEAVYDDLLPGERVRLHATYARALGEGGIGGTAAELARHARAAGDVLLAARASIEAGDEARAVGGPDEALRHYELALELATDSRAVDVDTLELTTKACESALDAGHTHRAIALARDQLRTISDSEPPLRRVRLMRILAEAEVVSDTEADHAAAVTSDALSLLAEHPDDRWRARLLALHARALSEQRRHEEAVTAAVEALELADRVGLPEVVAGARTTLARLRERPGETAASIAQLEESVVLARAAGELSTELRSMFNVGTLQYENGDLAAADAAYARARARAREAGRPWAPYALESRVLGIQALYVLGDWDQASALADLRRDSPPEVAEAMVTASGLLVRAGRGETGALAVLPSLASVARREGMVSLFSGMAAVDLHGDSGDIAAAGQSHDDTVAALGEIWANKLFQGRIR
ncbi:MAG: hypothetical protein QOE01_339, partial [Actinomycetota bacterium]|nr:hypothetical protein [Actinomycetota bacterium]